MHPSGWKEMVKSILQYLGVIHSPNLHQMCILTWSTDAMWWFVSLTYISCFSDHGQEEMVQSEYYSTYGYYIHKTYTNCSSWHDILMPHCGLCTWHTSHTWMTMVRKKWLSLYYARFTKLYTNCSSWHNQLMPHVCLCLWPTFHASVTMTQNGKSGALVMVPITILSSSEIKLR